MSRGLPYDSDEGRAYAAAITAIMTGQAYRTSRADLAASHGARSTATSQPRADAERHAQAPRRAYRGIDRNLHVPADLLDAAGRLGRGVGRSASEHGYRNARSRCWRRPAPSAS
jgi:ribonucleoside-diphosphate reductase alpha chain